MLEAVALVTNLLLLTVPVDGFRVPLPVLLLIVGMRYVKRILPTCGGV